MAGRFIDTNIVIYLTSGDAVKANRAEEIIVEGSTVSVQVLNEVANVARRKMRLGWPETRQILDLLSALVDVRTLTTEVHDVGVDLAERYDLSIYDAMIMASALEADCDLLYSEDMQHGMRINDRLTIVNPFVT